MPNECARTRLANRQFGKFPTAAAQHVGGPGQECEDQVYYCSTCGQTGDGRFCRICGAALNPMPDQAAPRPLPSMGTTELIRPVSDADDLLFGGGRDRPGAADPSAMDPTLFVPQPGGGRRGIAAPAEALPLSTGYPQGSADPTERLPQAVGGYAGMADPTQALPLNPVNQQGAPGPTQLLSQPGGMQAGGAQASGVREALPDRTRLMPPTSAGPMSAAPSQWNASPGVAAPPAFGQPPASGQQFSQPSQWSHGPTYQAAAPAPAYVPQQASGPGVTPSPGPNPGYGQTPPGGYAAGDQEAWNEPSGPPKAVMFGILGAVGVAAAVIAGLLYFGSSSPTPGAAAATITQSETPAATSQSTASQPLQLPPPPPTTAPPTTPPPTSPTGPITGYQGLCLDDASASTTEGNPIQIATCSGSAEQQWSVASGDTLQVFGMCMDITGGATSDGTQVDLYDCNGTGAQVWEPQADGALFNPQSGKCLDDNDWSTTPGTQLQIWDCTRGTNQVWTLPS